MKCLAINNFIHGELGVCVIISHIVVRVSCDHRLKRRQSPNLGFPHLLRKDAVACRTEYGIQGGSEADLKQIHK